MPDVGGRGTGFVGALVVGDVELVNETVTLGLAREKEDDTGGPVVDDTSPPVGDSVSGGASVDSEVGTTTISVGDRLLVAAVEP